MKLKRGVSEIVSVSLLVVLTVVVAMALLSFVVNYIGSRDFDVSTNWVVFAEEPFYSENGSALYLVLDGARDLPGLDRIEIVVSPGEELYYEIKDSLLESNERRSYKLYCVSEKPESVRLIPYAKSGDRGVRGQYVVAGEVLEVNSSESAEDFFNSSKSDGRYYDIFPESGGIPCGEIGSP